MLRCGLDQQVLAWHPGQSVCVKWEDFSASKAIEKYSGSRKTRHALPYGSRRDSWYRTLGGMTASVSALSPDLALGFHLSSSPSFFFALNVNSSRDIPISFSAPSWFSIRINTQIGRMEKPLPCM